MNGYNFTERVRKVLLLARKEAVKLRHEYVGTEHMLLAIMTEGGGVASATLRELGVDIDRLRDDILNVVKAGTDGGFAMVDLPYTGRGKRVLELAMEAARNFNHAYVGTEHLLLGLIREERGIAAQLMTSHRLTYAKLQGEVIRLLASARAPEDNAVGGEVTAERSSGRPRLPS